MVGAAMGPATGGVAFRLYLPADGAWRSADGRLAWSSRPCAAFSFAPCAGVRLARAVRLRRFGRRSQLLVDAAQRGPDMRLMGRTAIVTGAASGIGRASALLFASEGASIALVDRDAAGLQ